jgi:phage tail sheath protein FI
MNRDAPEQVATYVVEALRDSMYVQVTDEAQTGLPLHRRPNNGQFDLSPPMTLTRPDQFYSDTEGSQDNRTGLRGMFEKDEITMVACPDLMRLYQEGAISLDQLHGMMEIIITTCETTDSVGNCMAVFDSPHNCFRPQQVKNWLEEQFVRRSKYAALYYPWIKVPNPSNYGRPISVPPCGHMMGVWARVDIKRGVHKAPNNEVPRGVIGLNYDVNDREQGILNQTGINCIRKRPNSDIRIWGTSTLAERDDIENRQINVRRLINFISKSIELGTEWAVFEPNDYILWGKIRTSTTNFLERLWRDGALFGETPKQAFIVKCDDSNNNTETMALGRVHIDIKVAPVRPAEFVVFRISQQYKIYSS